MEYSKVEETDLKISRLGFGCWAIGGHGYGRVDDRQSIEAIRTALDLGINLFDTADVYGFGRSEEVLAKALGGRAKDVLIATKFGVRWDSRGNTSKDCSPAYMRQALDGSLRRLKIDCLPIYQIHWHDGKTPISAVMNTLQDFQKQGKVRYLGCSNLPRDMVLEADQDHKLKTIQLPYSIIEREREADLKFFHGDQQMATLAYGVLARGLLSGKYGSNTNFGVNDTRKTDPSFTVGLDKNLRIVALLKEISATYGKGPAQTAIRWVLDNPFITSSIVGFKTASQVTECADALEWRLKRADWERLADPLTSAEVEDSTAH